VTFSIGFLQDVRLQASSSCRAWTADSGCLTALEWDRVVETLPWIRGVFEVARLRVSEALSVQGVDPLGIIRALLLHESAAGLSRRALRAAGFVHLESASGLHLYALLAGYERGLEHVSRRFEWSLRAIRTMRILGPVSIWFSAFALTGFRAGLWRPLILVTLKWIGRRWGIRWARATPISVALLFDLTIGFFSSFGTRADFQDWAPGELHYALAWWGGILGYEWSVARGWGGLRSHAALSVGSWLVVLPLDFASGGFALATPVLSLITVEVLTRGAYFVVMLGALGTALGVALAPTALAWVSLIFNLGVSFLFQGVVHLGLAREISGDWGMALGWTSAALMVGVYSIISNKNKYLIIASLKI